MICIYIYISYIYIIYIYIIYIYIYVCTMYNYMCIYNYIYTVTTFKYTDGTGVSYYLRGLKCRYHNIYKGFNSDSMIFSGN